MSGKPKFFEINDLAVIRKMFDVCVHHTIPFTFWTRNQSFKFETTISEVFPNTGRIFVRQPPELSADDLEKALRDQGANEILGSFQLDSVNFFFRTTYNEKLPNAILNLQIPNSVFKLQRRANVRIPLPRISAPKLTLLKPGVEFDPSKPIKDSDISAYRMLDVSAGGLSFAAPAAEKQLFAKGTKLFDMRFKLREKTLTLKGKVAYIGDAKNDKGQPILKIGVEFSELRPADEQVLVQFALEESRKLFSLLN